MKFTEGRFVDWGYELAKEMFATRLHRGRAGQGGSRRARTAGDPRSHRDSMFSTAAAPFGISVIATPNLNGDYRATAAARRRSASSPGGKSVTACGVRGDPGTAPKYANLDKINREASSSPASDSEYMG